MPCRQLLWLAATGLLLVVVSAVDAADWPQFWGPNRDGSTSEKGLLKEWPKAGPALKWKVTDLGSAVSYSAPAVVNGRIFLLSATGNDEFVITLDEKDGKKIWGTKIGKVGQNKSGYEQYQGPRGTPTVVGDKLYALGSAGDLACMDVAQGKIDWSRNLQSEFAGKPGYWAYSESPLVDGDLVVATPGGSTASVVAFNKNTGATAWKCPVSGNEMAAYSSIIRADVGGIKQYIATLSGGLVATAASDGKLLWRSTKPATSNGITIATPVFHNDRLFGVAGYSKAGGVAFDLTADAGKVAAKELYFDSGLATSQAIGGYVRLGEHLVGTAPGKGGKGSKGGQLVCIEFKTGKIVWNNTSIGAPAALCLADGMFYVRGENGKVALVEATTSAYKERGMFDQPNRGKHPAWAYPVVANGCLYLRDMGVLLCYDIRDSKLRG